MAGAVRRGCYPEGGDTVVGTEVPDASVHHGEVVLRDSVHFAVGAGERGS